MKEGLKFFVIFMSLKKTETFKAKMKNCDSSNIPSCHQELYEQILWVMNAVYGEMLLLKQLI